MPSRRRRWGGKRGRVAAGDEADDEEEDEPVRPAAAAAAAAGAAPAAGMDEDDAEEEDEEDEEEEEGVHDGDEMQEVSFDVNVLEGKDVDGVFHLLQRWLPGDWVVDIDDVCNALAKSALTSIVKIPDLDRDREEGKVDEDIDLGDDADDIYGAVGLVDLHMQQRDGGIAALMQMLSRVAATDDEAKSDLGEWLTPAALQRNRVALVVNERLVNMPAELGAQLHVNLFEELEKESQPRPEYFLILSRVVLNADEQPEYRMQPDDGGGGELDAAAAGGQHRAGSKKARKRARAQLQQGRARAAVSEETAFFVRAEELFYFRHRHAACAVKRYIYPAPPEAAAGGGAAAAGGGERREKQALVPLLVHRSALPALLRDIRTLDTYFAEEGEE